MQIYDTLRSDEETQSKLMNMKC